MRDLPLAGARRIGGCPPEPGVTDKVNNFGKMFYSCVFTWHGFAAYHTVTHVLMYFTIKVIMKSNHTVAHVSILVCMCRSYVAVRQAFNERMFEADLSGSSCTCREAVALSRQRQRSSCTQ